MRIFIDGLDASGKSTFASKLGKTTIHSDGSCANDYEYFNSLFNYDDVILDRCHIGERVYSRVYNRECKLSDKEFDLLTNKMIENNDILVLFVCSDLSIINERLIERGEFGYLAEMPAQEKYYREEASKLNFSGFYVIDIAEEGAYDKLEGWIKERM